MFNLTAYNRIQALQAESFQKFIQLIYLDRAGTQHVIE